MVWEPYALAVFFGLVVSFAIYFIVMWPQVEPLEGDDLEAADAADAADAQAAAVTPPNDAEAVAEASHRP